MLKLTNSLYRFLVLTCEKVNKTHVRRFSHLNCKRKTCSREFLDIKLTAQFHSSLQLRQHGYGKKRLKIKIPPLNVNECLGIHNSMSDPSQPFLHHASHGGQFEVAVGDSDEWQQTMAEKAPSDEREFFNLGGVVTRHIPPNYRIWETMGHGPDKDPVLKFKVLSYNVLAQYLLEGHPYLYKNCNPMDIKWEIRAERLFEEIASLEPDILCFQEVQTSHIDSFFSRFDKMGFVQLFKKKTGHREDGCAIFFKRSMFVLKDQLSVEFHQPNLQILNRDNIGLMAKLSPRLMPESLLVVATTHLLYNPKRTNVRLAQMQLLLAELDRFAYYNTGKKSGHHPIILTGDFNSTPNSAVIKLLDRGLVYATPYRKNSDWTRIGVTDDCQHLAEYLNRRPDFSSNYKIKIYHSEDCTDGSKTVCSDYALMKQFSSMFNGQHIRHMLRLCSVYDSPRCATTFQDKWVTVDYMYFSFFTSLKLVERFRLPTVEECAWFYNLPDDSHGSDHLPLAATFELRPYRCSL